MLDLDNLPNDSSEEELADAGSQQEGNTNENGGSEE